MVDNIEMNIRDTGWGDMDRIDMAEEWRSVESSCEHGNEPSGSV
jgi:hypothetical protein